MELDPLTVLKKQYTIKQTLGDPGPFDIQYVGEDVNSKETYVIREFFPVNLVTREAGRTSIDVQGGDEEATAFQSGVEFFQRESEVLAELDHEVVSSGYTFFEANGTGYRARPQQSGMSLAQGLKSQGQLSEKAALSIMIPVLEGLQAAHDDGLYHGGVSPETIRLLEEGSVLLTGFRGAFIQFARQQGQLSKLVKPGTSAIEQYTPRGNQGPWTDVYAAAATITQMVTGKPLPEASDRLEGDDPVMAMIQDADAFSSPGVREALIDALTVDPSKRLQAADALSNALRESSQRYDESQEAYSILPVEPHGSTEEDEASEADEDDVEVLSTAEERPARSGRRSSRSSEEESSNRMALFLGIPLLVIALGGGAWFMMSSGGSSGGGGTSYADFRTRADSLYEQQEYEAARQAYRQALQQREDDTYVQQRLASIEEQMQSSSAQQYRESMAEGDSLKEEADSLFAEGSSEQANTVYSRAMAAYFSALDARTGDDRANQRIDQIERRQETIAEQQIGGDGDVDLQKIASFFQKQAEAQLEQNNPQAALRKYRQAAEYNPQNEELQQTISQLERDLQRQERQDQYLNAMRRGQEAMRQQNYEEARTAFQNAVDIWSSDKAEESLAEAREMLAQNQQREQAYEQYRTRADEAYQEGNYEEAIRGYKQALEARPDDSYAEEQLEKAQEELEELQLAKTKQSKAEERKKNMIGEDGVYRVVDKEPSVEGGLKALHSEVRYPEEASRRGIEGRVYVKAIVNKDGSVRSAEVARGIGGGCDREALRVVRDADFVPAKVDGKPVPSQTTVWIQFSL